MGRGGLLFADDFVGVNESEEKVQKLIDAVHSYCWKWRLKANENKSALMAFSNKLMEGKLEIEGTGTA